jgi:hypothetical protein
MRTRAQRRVRLRPNHLIASKARPAMSGMPMTREAMSTGHDGEPSGAKTTMATTITMSMNDVPHRGCRREKRWALCGVSASPAS